VLVLLLCVIFILVKRYGIHTIVESRIYRSAQLSDIVLERHINTKGIKTIINLRGKSDDDERFLDEESLTQEYDIDLFNIRLDPNELPEYRKLMRIISILTTLRKPVLIHCLRGVDRTGFVSAIALILEKNVPLSKAKQQFSWKYGVLPFYRSVGPYFFSQYEDWLLSAKKEHDRGTFLEWAEHIYIDSTGNLEFWLDHVNDIPFEKKRVVLPTDNPKITIDGWAFHKRTLAKPENLSIVVDGIFTAKPAFIYDRSDVARFLKLGEEHYAKYMIGWKAEFERDIFSSGCHDISLLVQERSEPIEISTERSFCL
jgi:protein tyrosine phosphatase (PTP) superfamily phosphohydrolase (DUF442 family)